MACPPAKVSVVGIDSVCVRLRGFGRWRLHGWGQRKAAASVLSPTVSGLDQEFRVNPMKNVNVRWWWWVEIRQLNVGIIAGHRSRC